MSSAVFLASAPLSVFNNTGAGGSIIEWGKETWQHNTAIRFAVSGIMGNVVFFMLDRSLFPIITNTASRLTVSNVSKWIIQNAASLSFFVAYLLDIAIQHLLNAWLVFGLDTISTRQLYLSSLLTSYTAYFVLYVDQQYCKHICYNVV